MKRPNLLFMMTDHQRADSLGAVRAGVEVTPNLNRLATDSSVFTRAYTTCPLCVPARTALATGLYPTRTGVVYNDWPGKTAGDFTPVHQRLAEGGYEVAHVGVHHIRVAPPIQERVPFAKWVDPGHHAHYLKAKGLDAAPPEGAGAFKKDVTDIVDGKPLTRQYSNTRTAVWPHAAEHFADSWFAREAAEFVAREHEKPFALFVYLWAPHPPLRVPEPYASLFEPGALDLPANVGAVPEGEPPGRRLPPAAQLAEGVPMEQWRKVWAAHLGLVNLADAGIGLILDALERSGKADQTVTLFTVDHGDHLGQHGMYQKMEMYEPAINIPLVVRVPGAGARRLDAPVSHLDVVPTLHSLLGVQAPEGLDGVSLADCIVGGAAALERPVFSQFSGGPDVGFLRRAVITRRHKYIYAPDEGRELYDLADDPLEMNNLALDQAFADRANAMHEACREWHESHNDWAQY